jgi:hypothetical protein
LGRNRDELLANITQHGLDAHARDLVRKSPDFVPTRRANGLSGGLRRCKIRQGHQPCLGFFALHPIPKIRLRDPQLFTDKFLAIMGDFSVLWRPLQLTSGVSDPNNSDLRSLVQRVYERKSVME